MPDLELFITSFIQANSLPLNTMPKVIEEITASNEDFDKILLVYDENQWSLNLPNAVKGICQINLKKLTC